MTKFRRFVWKPQIPCLIIPRNMWCRAAMAVLGLTLIGGSLAACGSSKSSQSSAAKASSQSSASKALTVVKFPVIPPAITDVFMPLYAAESLGIAKKNGIRFSLYNVDSGSALLTSVEAGVTPFSFVPISTAALAIAHGANIQVLAPTQPLSAGFILESKTGGGITKVSQLAGKSICVSQAGSETYLFAQFINSVDKLGATIVPVGASGQEPSLLTGKTAACVEAAPQSYQLIAQNKAVELVNFAKVAPIFGVVIAQKGYAKSHKVLTTELVKTWLQALAMLKSSPAVAEKEFETVNGETPSVAKSEYVNEIADTPINGAVTAAEVGATYKVLKAANTPGLPPESALETNLFADITG